MANSVENILLVIPTYNRSGKLSRVLDSYVDLGFAGKVVVLDGSDQTSHIAANISTTERHAGLVEYVDCSGQNDVALRIRDYLLTVDSDVVALGNDEDVFIPAFLQEAFSFLNSNVGYSAYVGGYITVCRSLLGLSRVSFWTDTFRGISLEDEEPATRVVNFQRMNGHGVSPLYWSVRRREVLIKGLSFAADLQYSSSSELIDQINCCVSGKIKQTVSTMLLRDESKVGY